jgi:hypothetical protein
MKMVSVARKLSMVEERRKEKIVRFGEEITRTEVTSPKTVLGSSFCKDVFRNNNNNNNNNNNINFSDIQRYVSNHQAYGKLSGNKD